MKGQSQAVSLEVVGSIDERIWERMAMKVIDKMPRKLITKATAHTLEDFAFMNSSNKETKGQHIAVDKETIGKLYEKRMSGPTAIEKRQKRILTEIKEQPPSNLSMKRVKKMTSRIMTEPIESMKCSKIETTAEPLIVSPEIKDEKSYLHDFFRATKNEQQKFTIKQKIEKEERKEEEEKRISVQRRKLKQSTKHTYDFQGGIVAIAGKKKENVKVMNVKSFFKASSVHQRHHFAKKYHQKACSTEVITKKVVSMDHFRKEEDSLGKFGKTEPISLLKMFQGDKTVEMGVSFTDLMENSTLYGASRRRMGKSMNLSEFKASNSSMFVPRTKGEDSKGKRKNRMVILGEEESVQSQKLSSRGCISDGKMGRIFKNQELYEDNFSSEIYFY